MPAFHDNTRVTQPQVLSSKFSYLVSNRLLYSHITLASSPPPRLGFFRSSGGAHRSHPSNRLASAHTCCRRVFVLPFARSLGFPVLLGVLGDTFICCICAYGCGVEGQGPFGDPALHFLHGASCLGYFFGSSVLGISFVGVDCG